MQQIGFRLSMVSIRYCEHALRLQHVTSHVQSLVNGVLMTLPALGIAETPTLLLETLLFRSYHLLGLRNEKPPRVWARHIVYPEGAVGRDRKLLGMV